MLILSSDAFGCLLSLLLISFISPLDITPQAIFRPGLVRGGFVVANKRNVAVIPSLSGGITYI